jgi:hypothetical protein
MSDTPTPGAPPPPPPSSPSQDVSYFFGNRTWLHVVVAILTAGLWLLVLLALYLWRKDRKVWSIATAAAFGLIVLLLGIGAATPTDEETASPETVTVTETQTTEEETTEGTTTEEQTTTTPTPTEEEPSSNETSGQENARESAESYLSFQAFSRAGLIKQLKFEGYSTADATYAVDNVVVDWNEQAAKSAQSYLDLQSFSRDGLMRQLLFEGFTRAQAEYGVRVAY